MALDAASYPALWSLFDQGGPRPEYVLPVLWSESNFNSSVINSIGCAGVNQACSALLSSLGVTAQQYATWPASEQIQKAVTPYMLANAPLNSGTRVYQANFLPATLKTQKALSSILAASPGAVYEANAGFDTGHTGVIRIQDLANAIARAAAQPAVQQAITAAYALRPGWFPKDPVYGTDYTPMWQTVAIASGILLGAGCIAYYIAEGELPTPSRLAHSL
jgi:hypothetical protein